LLLVGVVEIEHLVMAAVAGVQEDIELQQVHQVVEVLLKPR
tara:strand:+ start:240 stop:362 length:123 start_codon:yes stop_codon:yes gene_type:complete